MHVVYLCIALSAATTLTTMASETGTYSDETRTIKCTKTISPTKTTTTYRHTIKPHGKSTYVSCNESPSGDVTYSGTMRQSKDHDAEPLENPGLAFSSCQTTWNLYNKSAAVRPPLLTKLITIITGNTDA